MKSIRLYLKPFLLALGLVLLLSLAAGAVIHYTPLSEELMQPLGVLICVVSLFAGGLSAARRRGSRGLQSGLIIGALFALLIIASGLLTGVPFSEFAVKCAYSMLAAMLGGVFGVK